jgi:LPS sulfotransferase NodH
METVNRFVILAAPRTGSNWMCSMLNSHPQVLCHHGIFNPSGIHYALDHRAGDLDLGTVEQRDVNPLEFLARLWQHTFGKQAVGFKFNRDENERALAATLADKHTLKIVLKRRNRIRTFVSEMIAESTGQWESYHFSEQRPPPAALTVDAASLLRHVERNQRYYAQVEARADADGQSFLTVFYEDLYSRAEWARVLDFLRVSPDASLLRASTRKQNSRSLRELIANFKSLEAQLRGSTIEAELHAPDA